MKRKLKLGLIGNSISKTQSKKLHELTGEIYNFDASYELIDLEEVENPNIHKELEKCLKQGFDGVNVTHPYKLDAFKCIDVMDGFPKGLTSVNTAVFKDEKIIADNTDYLGFIESYKKQFGNKNPGKVLMLGAGGVGVAIAFGLLKIGVKELVIEARHDHLFDALSKPLSALGMKVRKLEKSLVEEMKECDGLINATPVGMWKYPGCAFPEEGLGGQTWSFDAVYTPVNTEFIKLCQKYNIETISGFKLFIYQGIEAFKRFSGIDVDGEKVEQAFLERYPLSDAS